MWETVSITLRAMDEPPPRMLIATTSHSLGVRENKIAAPTGSPLIAIKIKDSATGGLRDCPAESVVGIDYVNDVALVTVPCVDDLHEKEEPWRLHRGCPCRAVVQFDLNNARSFAETLTPAHREVVVIGNGNLRRETGVGLHSIGTGTIERAVHGRQCTQAGRCDEWGQVHKLRDARALQHLLLFLQATNASLDKVLSVANLERDTHLSGVAVSPHELFPARVLMGRSEETGPGDSGAPVIDVLTGAVVAMHKYGKGGYHFSTPADVLSQSIEFLLADARMHPIFLGCISEQDVLLGVKSWGFPLSHDVNAMIGVARAIGVELFAVAQVDGKQYNAMHSDAFTAEGLSHRDIRTLDTECDANRFVGTDLPAGCGFGCNQYTLAVYSIASSVEQQVAHKSRFTDAAAKNLTFTVGHEDVGLISHVQGRRIVQRGVYALANVIGRAASPVGHAAPLTGWPVGSALVLFGGVCVIWFICHGLRTQVRCLCFRRVWRHIMGERHERPTCILPTYGSIHHHEQ